MNLRSPNGDKSTDHEHSSVYWVLGYRVRGERIAAKPLAFSLSP